MVLKMVWRCPIHGSDFLQEFAVLPWASSQRDLPLPHSSEGIPMGGSLREHCYATFGTLGKVLSLKCPIGCLETNGPCNVFPLNINAVGPHFFVLQSQYYQGTAPMERIYVHNKDTDPPDAFQSSAIVKTCLLRIPKNHKSVI
jgi:hypothetical protein